MRTYSAPELAGMLKPDLVNLAVERGMSRAEAVKLMPNALATYILSRQNGTPEVKAEPETDEALRLLRKLLGASIDEATLRTLVAEEVAKLTLPREVEVKRQDGTRVNVGVQHHKFDKLVAIWNVRGTKRLTPFLVGEAGTGKSMAAAALARAVGVPFYEKSFTLLSSEQSLAGFNNAMTGEYVRTDFRRAYEDGGIFLLDEFDGCNPSIALFLNNALSNGHCAFPDRIVEAHADFLCVIGANTVGTGANRKYAGRAQLDGATLDRPVFIEWDLDEDLEQACVEAFAGRQGRDWMRYVRKVRQHADALGIRNRQVCCSPRAVLNGAALLLAGFTVEEAADSVIYLKLGADDAAKLKAAVK